MSQINVNTIAEQSSGSGVTIDSLLVKDGLAFSGIMQAVSWGPISGTGNQLEATDNAYEDIPNMTLTITPKVATSKIFYLASVGFWRTEVPGAIKVVENSSGSFVDLHEMRMQGDSTDGVDSGGNVMLMGLLDHNTTNAITIKAQGAKENYSNGSNRFRINWYGQESYGIAFEIGAI